MSILFFFPRCSSSYTTLPGEGRFLCYLPSPTYLPPPLFPFLTIYSISNDVVSYFQSSQFSSAMDTQWLLEFLKGMLKPVAALAVVAMAVALSRMQKLGLELEMSYAIVRAFVQLSIIGFVLQFIFNQENRLWILLAYFFMVRLLTPYTRISNYSSFLKIVFFYFKNIKLYPYFFCSFFKNLFLLYFTY